MNNLALSNNLNDDQFTAAMKSLEPRQQQAKPTIIYLNGENGVYVTKQWNESMKKSLQTAYQTGVFNGSILLVKWFAKWKYEEGSKTSYRTREFLSWNDPVELLKISFGGEMSTESVKTFANYAALKDEHCTTDKLTGKTKSPFDLWASVYIYDFSTKQVVNLRVRGSSRSNFWDYLGQYTQSGADALYKCYTLFRSKKYATETGSKVADYFAGIFSADRLITVEETVEVKSATLELINWMKSFEVKDEIKEDEPALKEDLARIPF